MKTLYDVLGVKKTDSAEEIRKVYIGLAKKLHPDKTGGDEKAEAELKEINAAYDTLKNKGKRQQYDVSLNPQPRFASGFGPMMSDMFSQQHRKFAPAQIQAYAPLTLEEVHAGCSKKIKYFQPSKCSQCNGEGGSNVTTCHTCGGTGAIMRQVAMGTISKPCNTCRGQGKIIKDPCKICFGSGEIQKEVEVEVTFKPSAQTNHVLIPGAGAYKGDLVVVFQVLKHKEFKLNGADIYLETNISLKTALLGGEIKVNSLKGQTVVKVPMGSSTGTALRLTGLGMPSGGNYCGDQYVVLNVLMPKNLSEEAKDLVEKLDKVLTCEV